MAGFRRSAMTTGTVSNMVPGATPSEPVKDTGVATDKTTRRPNVDEVVVGGKLYKKVAYQPDGPHSATQFRLEEVK